MSSCSCLNNASCPSLSSGLPIGELAWTPFSSRKPWIYSLISLGVAPFSLIDWIASRISVLCSSLRPSNYGGPCSSNGKGACCTVALPSTSVWAETLLTPPRDNAMTSISAELMTMIEDLFSIRFHLKQVSEVYVLNGFSRFHQNLIKIGCKLDIRLTSVFIRKAM